MTNLGVVRGNPDRVQSEVRSDFVAQTPETLIYDGHGNLVRDGRWVYSWDAENRLVRVMSYGTSDRAGWRRVDWAYDALGRRIRQTSYVLSNGVWVVTEDLKFVSDPVWFGRHLAELNATNHALVRSYVWGLDLSETLDGAGGVGGLLWVRMASGQASGTDFVTYDGNGNVWQLVSASTGTETARYEYGPFGEPLRTTGPAAPFNPFRYSTKRTDPATGLVLYEYRAYSLSLARWLTRDPLADESFISFYSTGKPLRDQKLLRAESLGPPYGWVANNGVSRVDVLGLRIEAAWCQQWFTRCVSDNLQNLRSCLGCTGPSIGIGLAACVLGCLKWLPSGHYATCVVLCAGVDSIVFLVSSARCLDAFNDGLEQCQKGYERCMERVTE
ncbi:RHS repeat domain-containing protein [Limisphaera sp. VF-2]|uniref:RHS repeat domain-containing protein n=1 Tax=Limisphaera sp. VF-2 TaxID=3400418 RepID=UPI003C172CE8